MGSKDQQFITPNNMSIYSEKLNEIFDDLSSKVLETNDDSTYENLNDKAHHIAIQAIDLDRADLSTLKIMVLNYFKFCLAETDGYQFDDSLAFVILN